MPFHYFSIMLETSMCGKKIFDGLLLNFTDALCQYVTNIEGSCLNSQLEVISEN